MSEQSHTAGEERGLLFADLADSSRMVRELGDARAREVLIRALELARKAIEEQQGRVIDRIGDELFCLLPEGESALRAAIAIQERTEAAVREGRFPTGVAFRIGFVHGPVLLRGNEVFGDSVYLAKRVASLAKAEQVLTTSDTLAALGSVEAERFVVVDRVRLKGRIDEVDLLEARWGTAFTLDLDNALIRLDESQARELWLRHGENVLVLSKERPVATIGRSAACELVVDAASVSRRHARIELGREGFALVDQSRNGTLLLRDGHEPRRVLRNSAMLSGAGQLRLGAQEGAPVVVYEVRGGEG